LTADCLSGQKEAAISVQFRFNWKVTLFSVVFLVLFINLGFWQLRRADEKVQLLARAAARAHQPPVTLAAVPASAKAADGLPVELHGQYDPGQVFLLDNRVVNSRVGFDVLVPFHVTEADKYALVNRGFVPMGRTRQDVPEIPPIAPGTDKAVGSIHVAAIDGTQPGDVDPVKLASGVRIVEVASPAFAAATMGKAFYPHVIRLAETDPNGLPRYWPVTVMMPSRHRAYAVQWFLMALAVVIAWSAFSLRREATDE